MNNKDFRKNQNTPPITSLIHFSWGGTTPEWENEAAQVMHFLQMQQNTQETKEERERKIQLGKQKQYW
jgi:hypothetical protein